MIAARLEYSIQNYSKNAAVKIKLLARSRGLAVKAEDSWLRGPGYKPPLWIPFFRHHSFGSKLVTKIVENSNPALFHVL